jgi:uncharacterized protein DUF4878
MRTFLLTVGLVATAIAIAGCGGSDDEGSSTSASTDTAAETTARPTPTSTTEEKADRGSTTDQSSGKPSGDDEPSGDNDAGDDSGGGGASGGGPSDEDKQQAGDAVASFFAALADGDGEEACSLITEQIRGQITRSLGKAAQLKGKDCGEIMSLISKNYSEPVRSGLENVKIVDVSGSGNTLTVTYTAGETLKNAKIAVAKQGDDWKVGALAGTGTP